MAMVRGRRRSAGAGVADSRDATAAALNPAGLVHVRTEASIAASLFSPRREVGEPSVSGATVESGSDYFRRSQSRR